MKIADLQDVKYKLLTDSQAVAEFAEGLGITDLQGSDSLFFCYDDNNDYISEVWGFVGIVPRLDKPVYSLTFAA